MDYAKTLKLKLRFLVWGTWTCDKEERASYTCSRVEEEEGARSCPCGSADESRTRKVGECELYKEGRNV